MGAMQLHRADMAITAQREDAQALLQALFGLGPPDEEEDGLEEALYEGRAFTLLKAAAYPLERPQLAGEAGPEARRLQQRMEVDALLAGSARVEDGGVRTLSERGDACFDIPALAHALQLRRVLSLSCFGDCGKMMFPVRAVPCADYLGGGFSQMRKSQYCHTHRRYAEQEQDSRRYAGAPGAGRAGRAAGGVPRRDALCAEAQRVPGGGGRAGRTAARVAGPG